MVSVNLTQMEVPVGWGGFGLKFGAAGAGLRAVELPQMRVEVPRCGPFLAKLGTRLTPAWQLSSARFVAQVTAAGEHYLQNRPMTIQRILVPEGTDVVVRGRPVTEDGTALLRADIATIDLNVFELTSNTPSDAVVTEGLSVDQLMETALAVTQGWRADGVGFCFSHTLRGSIFVEGGRIYRAEYIFRPGGGDAPISHILEVETTGLRTNKSVIYS